MNVQVTERTARAGHDLLVVKIDRDFGAGLGTISFLFGSGIIVEPDFAALQVTGVGGRRFRCWAPTPMARSWNWCTSCPETRAS